MLRRHFLGLLPLTVATPSHAEAWPTRPVRLIVPYPPGSGTDIIGRLLAQQLQATLGQPVVVENRSGAGGTLGTDAGAKAAADGYTVVISDLGPLSLAPHLYRNLPYEPATDLTPISLIARLPFVLVVHPSVPARTVAEFVALAKARPGGITYASVGNGSATHLSMELLTRASGVELTHVPYRGSAPALNDLVAGQVQAMFVNTASSAELIRDGKLRALAIGSRTPSPLLPGVPTLSQATGREMTADVWFGLLGPKGLDRAIVARLAEEIGTALRNPAVAARLDGLGAEPSPTTPDDFAVLIRSERDRWGPIIRVAGVQVE